MRLKTSGQRVCSFGLTNDAVESMGVGWMLDGWIEDGNDESNLEQITDLVSLMQSMRKFTGAKGEDQALLSSLELSLGMSISRSKLLTPFPHHLMFRRSEAGVSGHHGHIESIQVPLCSPVNI